MFGVWEPPLEAGLWGARSLHILMGRSGGHGGVFGHSVWAWVLVAAASLLLGIAYASWEGRYPAYDGRDLDCAEVGHQVRVGDDDPHGLDRDRDGRGCEWERPNWQGPALVGFLGGIGAAGAGIVSWRRQRVQR